MMLSNEKYTELKSGYSKDAAKLHGQEWINQQFIQTGVNSLYDIDSFWEYFSS